MKHYSPEQRRQYVDQWRASGLSAQVFAKQNGMAMSSLSKWSRDRKREAFMPVIVCNDASSSATGASPSPIAEIVIDGLSLRLFAGITSDNVVALIKAARESRT